MDQPEQAPCVDPTTALPTSLRQAAAVLRLDPAVWMDVLAAGLTGLSTGLAIKEIATGRYAYVSPRMAEIVGCAVEDLVGRTDADVFGSDVAASLRAADATTATLALPHSSDHRIERDHVRRDFQVTRMLLAGGDDAVGASQRYLCALWLDVSAQRQRDAQLALALQQLEQQQQATEILRRETQDATLRDADTGLFPNAQFDDQLRREVDLSLREHREFSMVSISIDPPTFHRSAPPTGTSGCRTGARAGPSEGAGAFSSARRASWASREFLSIFSMPRLKTAAGMAPSNPPKTKV